MNSATGTQVSLRAPQPDNGLRIWRRSAMRRVLAALVVASGAAFAQAVVNPARLSPNLKSFEPQPGERPVRCEVIPLKPVLNFGFRFQAGYVVRLPLNQYEGSGHRLALRTRITPEGELQKPVYLMQVVALPAVPKTRSLSSW